MEVRLLMVSGDRATLKPGPAQRRLMQLAERIGELHVVVPAPAHRQQLGPNVFVYGSGGSSRPGQWVNLVRRSRSLIRAHRCNVATAQDPFELGKAAYLATLGTGAKLHLQDHGAFLGNPLFPKISRRRRLQYMLGKWLVKRAARVRTVSQRGRRGLIAAGVKDERIDVVPIGTDVTRFSALVPGRHYYDINHIKRAKLLFIGRLEREKGLDVLLSALGKLKFKQEVYWDLAVVGAGSELANLKNLESSNWLDTVTWLGEQTDITGALTDADIVVIPSRSEGWGIVAIEAAASGVPVIMSDVGCAGEVFENDVSALIVPAGDVRALERAIVRLSADVELKRRLVAAAFEAVHRLPTPDQLMDAQAKSYAACL